MNIIFVEDGQSNRGLMALSICNYMVRKYGSKKVKNADFNVVATDKPGEMHKKAIMALTEFGADLKIYNKKFINQLADIVLKKKTLFIILGHDNKKKKVKKIFKENKNCEVEIWPIDNPLLECNDEVKLRFYRRTRDQLWVRMEEFISNF